MYEFASPDGKGGVGVLFGSFDYLCVRGPDADEWLRLGKKGAKIGASHDGRQLYILGAQFPEYLKKPGRKTSKGLDLGSVIAVAYTTVRDGKREEYIHDFRPRSRPQLIVSTRGSLILAGGAYQFKDSGINDL